MTNPSPVQLYGKITTPATAGGAGASVATVTDPRTLYGEIVAVAWEYTGTAPATTDLTLTVLGHDGLPDQVFVISASSAGPSGVTYPRVQGRDAAGALIAGEYTYPVVQGSVKIDVAQADDDVVATVHIFYRPGQ